MYVLNDGHILFDRFRIERFISSGGMGEIYKGYDLKLERDIAVKTIRKSALSKDSKLVEKFEREGLITAKLNHPNIVRLYDFLEDESNHYMILEYLDGMPLNKLVKTEKLSFTKIESIFNQAVEALKYLHNQNPSIFHRDISPHNIFVTIDGTTKLIDYGISKFDDAEGEITKTNYYKASYTCPDLWVNGGYKAQNYREIHDYYSLCLVKYEMLAGKKVFQEMEAVKGFPEKLDGSGDEDLVDVIKGKVKATDYVFKLNHFYSEDTKTDPAFIREQKEGSNEKDKKTNLIYYVTTLAALLLLTFFIRSHYYSIEDEEVSIFLGNDQLYVEQIKNSGEVFEDISLNSCILGCFSLMTYPSLYIDNKTLGIFESYRMVDQRWSHYKAMFDSSCIQRAPYCSLVKSVTSSFRQYMNQSGDQKTYKGFTSYLKKSLGHAFKEKDIIQDYLKRPSKYVRSDINFWDVLERFDTPLINQKKPFKNNTFFYFGSSPVGGKYHIVQNYLKDQELDYDLCKKLGDFAYIGHQRSNFFNDIPFDEKSFGVIVLAKDFMGAIRNDKKLFSKLPAKFDWIKNYKSEGVKYCKYYRSDKGLDLSLFRIKK